MFYPARPAELERRVDEMLAAAPQAGPLGRSRVLVSPHAGYAYSGTVAAYGFRAVADSDVSTVVLIGPSHVEYFDFSSVFDGDAYETPLGVLHVDHELAERVCAGRDTVRRSPRGHVQTHLPRGEHSLEVQLPFLQRIFADVRIVPIVMGEQGWRHCEELGRALAAAAGDDTLVLASTDLSHFYDARRAEELDAAFCRALATLSARVVHDAVKARTCEACGLGPVVAALAAVAGEDGLLYSELRRTHSGAVTGDNSSVVGYLSAVVTAGGAS
jgi:hypothetical protein